jgi:WD40 repeat protein
MTTDLRFERQLPGILEDLYLGGTPTYRDEAMAAVVGTRQRPAWTFVGRWLPASVADVSPFGGRRLPLRPIGVALVLLALLVATVLFVGSRQPKLPPPFGVAKNGLLAYSIYGDIYTLDSKSGVATLIVADPALDSRPVFSRDGTKLAFLRRSETSHIFDLMIARADGSEVRPVTGWSELGLDESSNFDFEWAPDSRSMIVYKEPQILRMDAVGFADPVVISNDAIATGRLGPTGRIPYQPMSVKEDALWTVGIDGGAPERIYQRTAGTPTDGTFWYVRYSPDGTKLAYIMRLPEHQDQTRIFIADADGTHAHRLTNTTGAGDETEFAWSPDSTRIAFNWWLPPDPNGPNPEPISIAAVDGGEAGSPVVAVGPSQGVAGALFEWSPDGSALIAMPGKPDIAVQYSKPLVVDVTKGEVRTLDILVSAAASWQRQAP